MESILQVVLQCIAHSSTSLLLASTIFYYKFNPISRHGLVLTIDD